MCWAYHEEKKIWIPWAKNHQLKLYDGHDGERARARRERASKSERAGHRDTLYCMPGVRHIHCPLCLNCVQHPLSEVCSCIFVLERAARDRCG